MSAMLKPLDAIVNPPNVPQEMQEVDPKTLQPIATPAATPSLGGAKLKPLGEIINPPIQPGYQLGPPAMTADPVAPPVEPPGIGGQLFAGLLESVDPIARNVFNAIQGTSGTPNAAPPLHELPGFELPTRTEGGGYFENAPSRVARTLGGVPTAIAEYAIPTIAAAPLGPAAPVVGFATTDAANAALTNRADVAMGREAKESVAAAAGKGALLGTGFEALKLIPSPIWRALLGMAGMTTVPPALEGRLPQLEDATVGLMGAMAGKGKSAESGIKPSEVIPMDLGPRANTSRSFEAQGPQTPQPVDTYKAGERAPITTTEGQQKPSDPVLAGTTTLGESRRQSEAFAAQGTPIGKSVPTSEPAGTIYGKVEKNPETGQTEFIPREEAQPTPEPTPAPVAKDPTTYQRAPLETVQEHADLGVEAAAKELARRQEVMNSGQEVSQNAPDEGRQKAEVLTPQSEVKPEGPPVSTQSPVASVEKPKQEAPTRILTIDTDKYGTGPDTIIVSKNPSEGNTVKHQTDPAAESFNNAKEGETEKFYRVTILQGDTPLTHESFSTVDEANRWAEDVYSRRVKNSDVQNLNVSNPEEKHTDVPVTPEPVPEPSAPVETTPVVPDRSESVAPKATPKYEPGKVVRNGSTYQMELTPGTDTRFTAKVYKDGEVIHEEGVNQKSTASEVLNRVALKDTSSAKVEKTAPITEPVPLDMGKLRTEMQHVEAERDIKKLRKYARQYGLKKIDWKRDPADIAHSMVSMVTAMKAMEMEFPGEGPKARGKGPAKADTGFLDDVKFVLEHIGNFSREHLVPLAKKLGVTVRGTTETIRSAVRKALEAMQEETGAAGIYDPVEIARRREEAAKRRDNRPIEEKPEHAGIGMRDPLTEYLNKAPAESRISKQDLLGAGVTEEHMKHVFGKENLASLDRAPVHVDSLKRLNEDNRIKLGQYTTPKPEHAAMRARYDEIRGRMEALLADGHRVGTPEYRASIEEYETLRNERTDLERNMRLRDEPQYSRATPEGGTNYREHVITLDSADDATKNAMTEVEHSALNDPGKLFHMRTTDRKVNPVIQERTPENHLPTKIDYDTNINTFNIDEIQSDLHQKGQREGYAGQHKTPEDFLLARAKEFYREHNPTQIRRYSRQGAEDVYEVLDERGRNITTYDESTVREEMGVLRAPNVPFKGEQWTELGIRRAIKMAIDEGKEYITWSEGKDIQAKVGGGGKGLRRFYDETMKKIANRIIRGYGGEVSRFVDVNSGQTKWGFRIPPKLAAEAKTKGMPLRAEHLANPLEHLAVIYDGLKTLAREQLIPLARKLGVAVAGATSKIRSAIGAEIKRLLSEETGAAKLPGKKNLEDFIESIKRVAAPRTETGVKKPRGTFREEKMTENKPGQQSFLQQLNDTLKEMDEGTMSIEQMQALGEKRLTEAGAVENILGGEHEVVKDVVAANILSHGMMGDIFDLAQKTDTGKVSAKDFAAVADKTIGKIHKLQELPTDAGRAVRYMATQWAPEMMKDIAEKLRNYKDLSKREKKAIEKMLRATTPESAAAAYNLVQKPQLRDYILEYYYNNLLSGGSTLTTNLFTTGIWAHAQIPLRALEGGSDMLRAVASVVAGKNYTRKVYTREALDLLKGMYWGGGARLGAREAGNALRGLPTNLDSAVEADMARSSEAWSRAETKDGKSIKSMRAIAPVIAGPSRLMRAADSLFKGMAMEGEKEAILHRYALNEAKSKGISYEEARRSLDRLLELNTPIGRALRSHIKKQTDTYAHYATFNDAPNRIMKWVLAGRSKTGIMGKLIIPFINTTNNIMARTVEFTPGLGLAKEGLSHVPGVGEGNLVTPQGFNNIAAKQIASIGIMAAFAAMFDDEDLTAKGPENPAQREVWLKTHQPWSFRTEDGKWHNYAKTLGPLSAPIASYAIWLEDQKNASLKDSKKRFDDPDTEERISEFAESFGQYFFESSWAMQLYGSLGYGKNIIDSAERQGARVASGLVPYNGLMRSLFGTMAENRDENYRKEANTFWEYYKQQSPVLEVFSDKLEPRLDVEGQALHQQGGVWKFWLPVGVQETSTNPVEVELSRVADATGFAPAPPSPLVSIEYKDKTDFLTTDHTLSRPLYRKYAIAVGKEFNKEFAKMQNERYYKRMSDAEKAQEIGTLHGEISQNIRDEMQDEIVKDTAAAGHGKIKRIGGANMMSTGEK